LKAKGIGGYEDVDLVRPDSLVVGSLVMYSQVGGMQDLSQLARFRDDAVPFGGILGYTFLAHFPVQVDYRQNRLVVYNPDRFTAPADGHIVPFDLTMQIPTIEAELNSIPGEYIVDLGNSFGLVIHSEFGRRHQLLEVLDDVREFSAAMIGVGDELQGHTAYAASFAFGDIRISDLRVMLPESSGGLSGSVELAGNIGNLLLEQFRVLFDYRGQRLVFFEIAE
jgi:hypothetical protein